MKNKFVRGLCVILAATLFVGAGIVLKTYSDNEAEKEKVSKEELEAILNDTNKDEVVKEATFTDAPEGYFDDALFIGDSRTVGLKMYCPIEGATYFATVGLNVYEIEDEKADVEGVGKVTLTELLENNTYGKVYIMLGINELGFDYDTNLVKYKNLIDKVREYQPDSIIFIEANLRVGPDKSNSHSIINNKNIDKFNNAISEFANNVDIVYIDVNPIFDDGNGNLNPEITGDDVHLHANYYTDWVEWLKTKAIVHETAADLNTTNESE